jgi:phosphate starvation-inducible PhoH-like protein
MALKKSVTKRKPKYQDPDYAIDDRGVYQEFMKFNNITLTPKQQAFCKTIKDNKVCVCLGPAGSSKSFSAIMESLKSLKKEECEKIIFTKAIINVQNTNPIGFIKGDLSEKLEPYMASFQANMVDILNEKDATMLIETKKVEFKPIEYMRGSTFKNSFIIIDEFQNLTLEQLMTVVTRLGKNSKMVFIGDIKQSDIKKSLISINIFKEVLSGIENIGFFEFTKDDIVREEIIKKILDNYDRLVEEGKIIE